MEELNKYIEFRYSNWLDFANHLSRVHYFNGWADDLLNDVIIDLLKKDLNRLLGMLSRKTKKIVNGQPTTELDKFVLSMLRTMAFSAGAPFRKNTLGQKIIHRSGNKVTIRQQCEINSADIIDECYDETLNTKLDEMHAKNITRLKNNGFTNASLRQYRSHFIRGRPENSYSIEQQITLTRIRQFLTETKKTLLDD